MTSTSDEPKKMTEDYNYLRYGTRQQSTAIANPQRGWSTNERKLLTNTAVTIIVFNPFTADTVKALHFAILV